MFPRSLQLTFIEGRPIAAYLSLPIDERVDVARTTELSRDLIVDFNHDGAPIGVEIISFGGDVPARLNQLLRELGIPPLSPEELRPLQVA
jgi:hypothetical protein